MIVAAFWDIDTNSKSEFVIKSQQLWGEGAKVNWRTAFAYDATQALIAAIKSEPTRNGVQKALPSPQLQASGASGNIEFFASGDRKNANTLVQLVKIVPTNNSGVPYKFTPVPSSPTATSTSTNK